MTQGIGQDLFFLLMGYFSTVFGKVYSSIELPLNICQKQWTIQVKMYFWTLDFFFLIDTTLSCLATLYCLEIMQCEFSNFVLLQSFVGYSSYLTYLT